MAAGVKGDFHKLSKISAALRKLPMVAAQKAAARVAPAVTDASRAAFQAGQTVYGDARPLGVDGNLLTLHKTGRLFGSLQYKAIGTIVRCVLGPPYAKYNIRYGILPRGGATLPFGWIKMIKGIVSDVLGEEVSRAA